MDFVRLAVRSERSFRKVPEVVGDDHPGLAPNCGGEDVPVVRVGQTEPVDQEALRRRLGKEERVVLVITPEKYLPSRFESRG